MFSRAEYVAAVAALAQRAENLRADGAAEEVAARELVALRNAIKVKFRVGLPSHLLKAIHDRNMKKYGDPVGPDADALLLKYGHWAGVIEAARRPADLQSNKSGRTLSGWSAI